MTMTDLRNAREVFERWMANEELFRDSPKRKLGEPRLTGEIEIPREEQAGTQDLIAKQLEIDGDDDD